MHYGDRSLGSDPFGVGHPDRRPYDFGARRAFARRGQCNRPTDRDFAHPAPDDPVTGAVLTRDQHSDGGPGGGDAARFPYTRRVLVGVWDCFYCLDHRMAGIVAHRVPWKGRRVCEAVLVPSDVRRLWCLTGKVLPPTGPCHRLAPAAVAFSTRHPPRKGCLRMP